MIMNVDFAFILTVVVAFCGIVSLVDFLIYAPRRKLIQKKMPLMVEYARSFFPVLLLVWGIRSFIVQPYRVPTGSLEPTVMPGDFIVVNQFSYGLRFPIGNKTIIPIGHPKRGDIALFFWPVDTSFNFVKRVIGTPGDHIIYKNKQLTINGHIMEQTLLDEALDIEPGRAPIPVERKKENLGNVTHQIFVRKTGGETADIDVVVPKNMYFMMGDNRDNSDDSRTWGFVPEANLIGKAMITALSWNSNQKRFRWGRSLKRIK